MIKAILFPSDVFSIREVDSSYQNEYEAVIESGDFQIYLYDYEEFVRNGILRLNRTPAEKTCTLLRGWMLKAEQYESFYNQLLERNIELITTPEQYCTMHLFPNVYPLIAEDTPRMLVYPETGDETAEAKINLDEIKSEFPRFMVKDFVKSEKGTDFPKFFDSAALTEKEFFNWLRIFRQYRDKLFTGGICIKEFVDLKKYGDRTNEWRVFYLGDNVLSMCRNSGQLDFVSEVPKSLVEKYRKLPSPFYTVDYAELEDGSWMILEAGDGQVSGLSDEQDASVFFRGIKSKKKIF